ncbi:DUF1365 domain-containing protein [Ancylobacter dichloromethanicus]|uniref:DUF1365 domain-containing protein n=1 Tax=Ancylobacter dichloromethanicus TaxID=518825 RepID=A0A9W6JAX1_9HYPH|nr:DUF1365 domain-containing protein [Ancylobacter dichloromethanicus]MBS7553156.1 DUF1365 domain-containing protein [Ancylobacter dichloromethanicus]GLK72933.1 DUF1365 domain-containing protein [Ancylobacter dichloromethanicus]
MNAASALYAGSVMHVRLKPRRHRLVYRLFSLLLDLDEIDALDRRLRLFSRNRFNAFSFFERDYADPKGGPLKAQVERLLGAAGLEPDGGAIRLLTMPRLLGYAFNPLSVYFCHRRDGSLLALLYEVNNTFGQRHCYLIPVGADDAVPLRQKAEKRFYVSPFLDMGLTYAFRVTPPGEELRIAILASDDEGPVLSAVHSATRRPLTDGQLAGALVRYPLLTLKVTAGIHWEALLIWAKGIALRPRPKAPDAPVSLSPSHRS